MPANRRTTQDSFAPSVRWYVALIGIGFLVILTRLWWLQVAHGDEFKLASIKNIIQTIDTIPPRGDIFDRTGRPLAKSRNVFSLLYFPPANIKRFFSEEVELDVMGQEIQPGYLHNGKGDPGQLGQRLDEIAVLAELLDTPYADLMEKLGKECLRVNGKQLSGFRPATLAEELTTEQAFLLEEAKLEGTYVDRLAFARDYPLGESAAHVTGFTGLIHGNDPQSIRELDYGPRVPAGKDGVERSFEHLLHGIAGKRDIEIDRARMVNRSSEMVARERQPERGADLYLTLDAEIQSTAFDALQGKRGAVIVSSLKPGHEGKLLALVSSPSYDPEQFNSPGYFYSLIKTPEGDDNENRPLLNRAFRSAFPPGSTFKLVTATAALQTGAFSQGTGFYCKGYIELGRNRKRYHCHKRTGHKSLTFLEGISESCDVVFYEVALDLERQEETIHSFGEYFGYGSPVGIELSSEASGLLPNAAWKRGHYASDRWYERDRLWYDGDTVTYAIGQSYLQATPLQVLWSSNIVALEGMRPEPRLLKSYSSGESINEAEYGEPLQLPLDKGALLTVKRGMRLAVTDGTCSRLDIPGLTVCAKSGTAQTGIEGQDDHAWVVGFYPQHEPEVGFVVFVENGGSAGEAAIPVAKQLLTFMKDRFDGSPMGE